MVRQAIHGALNYTITAAVLLLGKSWSSGLPSWFWTFGFWTDGSLRKAVDPGPFSVMGPKRILATVVQVDLLHVAEREREAIITNL